MLKIGITGNIGTGKSEVCKILKNLGCFVISSDNLAKFVMNNNEQLKTRIRETLGNDVYSIDGIINRKKIAQMIFENEILKIKLEKIVHPFVIDQIKQKFQEIKKTNLHKLVFLESALIYEADVDKILDYNIVVYAPEKVCIARVMKRDGLNKDEIVKRIRSQLPITQKLKLADFVIYNNGTKDNLEKQVKFIYTLLNQI